MTEEGPPRYDWVGAAIVWLPFIALVVVLVLEGVFHWGADR